MRETQKTRFFRQTAIFNPEEIQEQITIIGGGNIGSSTAYGLAKLGLKFITVYEFDIVEEHNLSSQFYGVGDVGKPKIDCLSEHIKNFTGTDIMKDGEYIDQEIGSGILIIAVDSMPMREKICAELQLKTSRPRMIIDGRMGEETIELYTRETPEEYKETLSGDVVRVPCSARYISYSSLLIAGLITNQVKRILKAQEIKRNIIFDIATLRFA